MLIPDFDFGILTVCSLQIVANLILAGNDGKPRGTASREAVVPLFGLVLEGYCL